MLQTVEAILEPSGQIRLLESVQVSTPCRVLVTVLDTPPESGLPNGEELSRLLEEMAGKGAAEAFGDPLEWQRNERVDRTLPGRDEP